MATLHLALKIGFHFSPISWGKDRISFLMTSFSCDFDELLTASKVLAVHVFFLWCHHVIYSCCCHIWTFQGVIDITSKYRQILCKPEKKYWLEDSRLLASNCMINQRRRGGQKKSQTSVNVHFRNDLYCIFTTNKV